MQKALAEAGFIEAANAGRWYATPRRLALQFDDCLESQPDRVIEKKGPAVASGVGADGTATKALEGFMRSAGVEFAQLEKLNDGKADYFVARIRKTGGRIDEYLAGMVEAALKKLPVAKLMRWGDGDAQFVRPVHGLILMHDGRTIARRSAGPAQPQHHARPSLHERRRDRHRARGGLRKPAGKGRQASSPRSTGAAR
jgi:glycyl-tRNA synthetase beta chain